MNRQVLKVLLVDEGMNTGDPNASKIGGGQMARRRFFSDPKLFKVTVLTSENEVVRFWKDRASIVREPRLETYRPLRVEVAEKKIKWLPLVNDALRAARILNHHLAVSDSDVVFLNDNKSRLLYILGGFLAWGRKHPPRTAIQVDGEWKLGVSDFIMKFLYILVFDRIICSTKAVRDSLGVLAGLYSHKMIVAYPGVEVPDEDENQLKLNKQPDDGIVFGCIGTLRAAVKGQDIVIRAVSRLIKMNGHMAFKVYFFGDGPDRTMLANLIRELGVSPYCEFKGYVQSQREIYSQMDACILASRTEVAPLVLMECLVRNLPVITADLAGCSEILSDFYDNLFFEQGSDEDLSSKLESALKSDVLKVVRKRIRNTDKKLITKNYQVRQVFEFLAT